MSSLKADNAGTTAEPLLRVRDLAVSFAWAGGKAEGGGRTRAVEDVSLTVFPGQTVAVVGESGSGKSVTALATLGLLPKDTANVEAGSILLGGGQEAGTRDLLTLGESRLRQVRGREIAMIFQEPMTSLNPVYTIGEQIEEAVRLHRGVGGAEATRIVEQSLADVAIGDVRRRLGQYPHEFSGGMRQRVMIAMALACQPRLLLADEPTTALDVTVQAQILRLLRTLQRERGLAILLITHSMGVVAENADVVCVMYKGRVVEYASVFALFDRPLHPYTRGLLLCTPVVAGRPAGAAERLTTMKDVLGGEGRIDPIGPGLTPWWPDATPPAGSQGESVLVEIEPDRWVRVWKPPGTAGLVVRPPTLSFRREGAFGLRPTSVG